MKKTLCIVMTVAAGWAAVLRANAQDVPGFAAGTFFEHRTENTIDNNDLSFDYYGLRFKVRDERFVEVFADLGIQGLNLKDVTADDAGAFGLGGSLWLTRADGDVLPLDVGVYGSFHVADYTLKGGDGSSTDAKHTRYLLQGVVRAFDAEALRPYLRAGIMGTKLSPDKDGVLPDNDQNAIKPAVNVGAEYNMGRNLVLNVEANYAAGVGGAIHLDYWF